MCVCLTYDRSNVFENIVAVVVVNVIVIASNFNDWKIWFISNVNTFGSDHYGDTNFNFEFLKFSGDAKSRWFDISDESYSAALFAFYLLFYQQLWLLHLQLHVMCRPKHLNSSVVLFNKCAHKKFLFHYTRYI